LKKKNYKEKKNLLNQRKPLKNLKKNNPLKMLMNMMLKKKLLKIMLMMKKLLMRKLLMKKLLMKKLLK